MIRNFEKLKQHKKSYEGTGLMDDLQFGECNKLNKYVSFIPNICQLETQKCFQHRKLNDPNLFSHMHEQTPFSK